MTLQSLIEKLQCAVQDRGQASITIKIDAHSDSGTPLNSPPPAAGSVPQATECTNRSEKVKWWAMFLVAVATMIATCIALI